MIFGRRDSVFSLKTERKGGREDASATKVEGNTEGVFSLSFYFLAERYFLLVSVWLP